RSYAAGPAGRGPRAPRGPRRATGQLTHGRSASSPALPGRETFPCPAEHHRAADHALAADRKRARAARRPARGLRAVTNAADDLCAGRARPWTHAPRDLDCGRVHQAAPRVGRPDGRGFAARQLLPDVAEPRLREAALDREGAAG